MSIDGDLGIGQRSFFFRGWRACREMVGGLFALNEVMNVGVLAFL